MKKIKGFHNLMAKTGGHGSPVVPAFCSAVEVKHLWNSALSSLSSALRAVRRSGALPAVGCELLATVTSEYFETAAHCSGGGGKNFKNQSLKSQKFAYQGGFCGEPHIPAVKYQEKYIAIFI